MPRRARQLAKVAPSNAARRGAPSIAGLVIGRLMGLGEEDQVEVHLVGSAKTTRSRSMVPVTADDVGREVAVALSGPGQQDPLVVGFVQSAAELARSRAAPGRHLEARLDGTRVVLEAEQEIELRCGKSTLLLRADGKIVLRGENLVSSAAGPNRIRGGSVQIN